MPNSDKGKKQSKRGPQAHPTNAGGPKRGSSEGRGVEGGRGGNKVSQGQGSDTGNRGKG
jgi:hypothetical protein